MSAFLKSPPSPTACWRMLATVLLAALAGELAQQAHLPLPWMLGPLFSVACLRIAGLPLRSLPGGRQAGQWAIGTALGLYFTPLVLNQLYRHAAAILLMSAAALLLGLIAARLLQRWAGSDSRTAFFAGLPGGASEMVVLCERHGGRSDRVAAAHALRVMLVVSIIPFALHHGLFAEISGHEIFQALNRDVNWLRLPWLLLASGLGVALLSRLRIANAWVLGPLATIGALTAAEIPLSSLPVWMVNGGQLLLGIALGCRFAPGFFKAAPRFLAISTLATLLSLALCTGLTVALAWLSGLPAASLLLAASPGGMAEMSITARELALSVPLVTATHVLRVVLLTVLAPALFHLYRSRQAAHDGAPHHD